MVKRPSSPTLQRTNGLTALRVPVAVEPQAKVAESGRAVMQARFDPDTANSLQFSFDRTARAADFGGNFGVRGPLELEQYDSPHGFIGNRFEQLGTAFGDLGEVIGRNVITMDRVDACIAKRGEPGFTANQSAAALLTIRISPLGGDFSGGDYGQQPPEGVAVCSVDPSFGESAAEAVEGAIRRVLFVVPAAGLHVELVPGEFLQPHRNMMPQLFGRLMTSA